jgi:protein TonB
VVKIVVDEQGKVVKAESICGHRLLTGAAEDAARAARFTPTLLLGQPVKVSGYITYNFVLQ